MMAPTYAWKKILLLCYFQVACCLAFLGWIPQKFHLGQEAVDEATKERVIKECVTTFPFPQAEHEAFKVNGALHIDHDQDEDDDLQKIIPLAEPDRLYFYHDLLRIMYQMDEEERYPSFKSSSRYIPAFPVPLDKHRALKLYRALHNKIDTGLTAPSAVDYNQQREDLQKIKNEVDQLKKDFIARSGDVPQENSKKITQTLGALTELHQNIQNTIGEWIDTWHYQILARRENQIENLSNLIHGLVLPQNQEQRSSFKYLEEVSLKLQRIVFQTVDWMVNHGLWDKGYFQDFYRQSDIIQLAAINLVRTFNLKYKQTGLYPAFPRSEYILGDNYSSHFKSISTVLDEAEKKEFSYSSMKAVFTYCYSNKMKEMESLIDLIFSDDYQIFYELQQSLTKKKTISSETLVKGDRTLKFFFERIVEEFQNEKVDERGFNKRITMEFIYLNFIQVAYGKDLIEIENWPYIFQERFKVLSFSVIFIEELEKLKVFLHDLLSQDHNISKNKSVLIKIHKIKLRQNLSLARDYLVHISRNHFEYISNAIQEDSMIKCYSHLNIVKKEKASLIELMHRVESKTGDESPQFILQLANDVKLDEFDYLLN